MFPISYLIPIGALFQLEYNFQFGKSLCIREPQKIEKVLRGDRICFDFSHKSIGVLFWSFTILKRVEEVFNRYYFSNMFSPSPQGK
jgi:hypothetical protein